MIGRIIDIAQNRRHLSLKRGFLVVSYNQQEQGRIPLDDMAALIVSGHGTTHSSNLLAALAERSIPFVLCASNHHPVGILWATESHHRQSGRMDAQLAAARPLQKQLWQQLIRSKLHMQAATLECLGVTTAPLHRLAARVRSGDPDNIEAQGARLYWPLLFGPAFRRNRHIPGINTLLNYGYTLLRSATARSVMAAGLHPGLGLHHRNTLNPMRLVDDLMEPYRPLVDLRVYGINVLGEITLDATNKKRLAQLLYHDLVSSAGKTPVMGSIHNLVNSLAQAYENNAKTLQLPCQNLTSGCLQSFLKIS